MSTANLPHIFTSLSKPNATTLCKDSTIIYSCKTESQGWSRFRVLSPVQVPISEGYILNHSFSLPRFISHVPDMHRKFSYNVGLVVCMLAHLQPNPVRSRHIADIRHTAPNACLGNVSGAWKGTLLTSFTYSISDQKTIDVLQQAKKRIHIYHSRTLFG